MPDKRLHLKVGIFSLLALALLVAGVGLLASGAFLRTEEDYVLYFEGSVAGLSVGAPVVFRGVPLGKVMNISLLADVKEEIVIIPVGIDMIEDNIIQIAGDHGRATDAARREMMRGMIEQGLRARVAMSSLLTGQARIDLDFFPETPARYHSTDHSREIPTLSSPLEELSRALSRVQIDKIAHNLLTALENVNKVLTGEEFTGTLSGFKHIAQEMPALLESAQKALQRIETVADRAAQEVPKIGHDVSLALDSVNKAANRADKLFLDANQLVSPNSATMRELHNAAKELAEAARAIRSLARSLERNPESLLRGRGRQQP